MRLEVFRIASCKVKTIDTESRYNEGDYIVVPAIRDKTTRCLRLRCNVSPKLIKYILERVLETGNFNPQSIQTHIELNDGVDVKHSGTGTFAFYNSMCTLVNVTNSLGKESDDNINIMNAF